MELVRVGLCVCVLVRDGVCVTEGVRETVRLGVCVLLDVIVCVGDGEHTRFMAVNQIPENDSVDQITGELGLVQLPKTAATPGEGKPSDEVLDTLCQLTPAEAERTSA